MPAAFHDPSSAFVGGLLEFCSAGSLCTPDLRILHEALPTLLCPKAVRRHVPHSAGPSPTNVCPFLRLFALGTPRLGFTLFLTAPVVDGVPLLVLTPSEVLSIKKHPFRRSQPWILETRPVEVRCRSSLARFRLANDSVLTPPRPPSLLGRYVRSPL